MENIIDYLRKERVVKIALSEDKTEVSVIENCDGWFTVYLNKSQLLQLINELTDIHSKMINESKQ